MVSKPSVVALIQARFGSQRLPGKVLEEAGGKTILQMVVERVRMVAGIDQVVVVTSTDRSDDVIEEHCRELHVDCFRGELLDVLARFEAASKVYPADAYVRITADSPLLDPELVAELLIRFWEETADYARFEPVGQKRFPLGLEAEVFTSQLLQDAARNAVQNYQREHVTPFMYESEGNAKIAYLPTPVCNFGELRWTLDTLEDLRLIHMIIDALGHETNWTEILNLVSNHPEMNHINQEVSQRPYNHEAPKP